MSTQDSGHRGKRPARPRRAFPGIAAVFSGGRWRWRACIAVKELGDDDVPVRRQRVGPLRDDQREAARDVEDLRKAVKEERRHGWTVLEAINAAIQRKIDEGLAPHSITGDWRNPAKAILRRFRGDALLETLTVEVVRRWALEQLDAGLAPRTVSKGRLNVLNVAFDCAKIPSPVPEVKRILRLRLRPRDTEVPGLELDEFRALLERARAWRSAHRRQTPNREVDLLLIELVATTGIRHDELARVRRRDVWMEQGAVVVTPKVRRRTRMEPIVPELREALAARLAALPTDDSYLVPGYGVARPGEPAWAPQTRYLGRMRERWKKRLGEPRFSLRVLRRAHGTALDSMGSRYAVIREALGHTRTSQETTRYLQADRRAVTEAKQGLATHLLPPRAQGHSGGQTEGDGGAEPQSGGPLPGA